MTQDIIRRILQNYFGYDVNFVMNITDIDDKVRPGLSVHGLIVDHHPCAGIIPYQANPRTELSSHSRAAGNSKLRIREIPRFETSQMSAYTRRCSILRNSIGTIRGDFQQVQDGFSVGWGGKGQRGEIRDVYL